MILRDREQYAVNTVEVVSNEKIWQEYDRMILAQVCAFNRSIERVRHFLENHNTLLTSFYQNLIFSNFERYDRLFTKQHSRLNWKSRIQYLIHQKYKEQHDTIMIQSALFEMVIVDNHQGYY